LLPGDIPRGHRPHRVRPSFHAWPSVTSYPLFRRVRLRLQFLAAPCTRHGSSRRPDFYQHDPPIPPGQPSSAPPFQRTPRDISAARLSTNPRHQHARPPRLPSTTNPPIFVPAVHSTTTPRRRRHS